MSNPDLSSFRASLVLLALVLAALVLPAAACAAPDAAPASAPKAEPEAAAGELRRMAITVDDLPVGPPGRHTTAQQAEIIAGLLAALAAHDAPAIGFVNESKLEVDGVVDPGRVALLERWLEAGREGRSC